MDKLETQIRSGRLNKEMSFNQRVWTLTSQIPSGRVATYSSLAKRLGTRGFRAVGNALNRNPYAPQVPCHRVVGSDGQLRGYAGGLDKKRQLLEAEGIGFVGNRVNLKNCAW